MLNTFAATLEFVPRVELSADVQNTMFDLYTKSYDTTREAFDTKLSARIELIALFHDRRSRRLVGFCGLANRVFTLSSGTRLLGIYMGQSHIDRAWRGRNLIQRMIVTHYLRMRRQYPGVRVFSWTNAVTVRTWLVGASNLVEYWPRPDRPMPPDMKELHNMIGQQYYPGHYDPASGVVHKDTRTVSSGEIAIDSDRMSDPLVRFFAETNPGYLRGDGLLMITPGSFANIRFWLLRQARRQLQKLSGSQRS